LRLASPMGKFRYPSSHSVSDFFSVTGGAYADDLAACLSVAASAC
jgi:hypothetical protein